MPYQLRQLWENGPSMLPLFRFVDLRDTARMDTTELKNYVSIEEAAGTPPTPHEKLKLTYSVAEAASLLGVSRPTIYRLMARRIRIPIPGLRNKRIPKKQVRRLGHGESLTGLF